MKAFALRDGREGEPLYEVELPVPTPGVNEVVIAVKAAGVTPTELRWYPTTHNRDGSARKDAVPGHEFSGTVSAVGQNVSRFQPGDVVFGLNDWFQNGATAAFCASNEDSIIRAPAGLSHETAAATPIAALTAWQGLVERAKVKRGDRVLIVGASGSVGLMAVQIAKLYGCSVSGSASAMALAELRTLGCEQVLDYKSQPFVDYIHDIDVVFDTVGGNTLAAAKTILKSAGRMVTVAADAESNDDPLIKAAYFTMEPSTTQLEHIAQLIEQEKLRVFVKGVVPFLEAPQAYSGQIKTSSLGKLVLSMRPDHD